MEDTADEPVDISTHTLTWSVTFAPKSSQSTSLISTHTLTWSVTRTAIKHLIETGDFNSHAHVERDTALTTFPPEMRSFQLTRSRGA